MKIIRVKKELNEAIYKIGDPKDDAVIWDRVVDLRRVANLARQKAEKAKADGKAALADMLVKKAEEFEELADNANVDSIDDENEDALGNHDAESDANEENKDQDKSDSEKDSNSSPNTNDNNSSQSDNSNADSQDKANSNQNNGTKQDSNNDNSQNSQSSNPNEESDSDASENEDADESEDEEDAEEEDGGSQDDSEGEGDEGVSGADEDAESDSDLDDEESESTGSDEEDDEESTQEKSKSKGQSGKSEGDEEGEEETSDSEEDAEEEEGDEADEEQSGSAQDQSQKQSKGGKAPKKDPFADNEDIPSLALPSQNGQMPEEANLDDILKQLQRLTGEAKKGAKDALQAILNQNWPKTSTTESLHLQEKLSLRDMDDETFMDLLNQGYDLIKQADPQEVGTPVKDRKGRMQEIQDILDDPSAKSEIIRDLTKDAVAEKKAKQAKERANARFNSVGTMKDFSFNIYKAVADEFQYDEYTDYSYDEIEPEYEDEDVRVKAEVTRERNWPVKPIIDVYFDQSGSWNADDTEVGKRAINSLIEFEEQDLITINLWYFSDFVTADPNDSMLHRGTTAWAEIIENIRRTGANNVVIMTDDDFQDLWQMGRIPKTSLTIPGYVWWIWKNNEQSPDAVKLLRGRKGCSQYSFNRNG